MISDELMRKAIKAWADGTPDDDQVWDEIFDQIRDAAHEAIAPAIRAAALEEAANVASGQRAAENEHTRLYLVGYYTAASNIAAAIRALKDTP